MVFFDPGESFKNTAGFQSPACLKLGVAQFGQKADIVRLHGDGFFTDGDQFFKKGFLLVNPHKFIIGKTGKNPALQFPLQQHFPIFKGLFFVAAVPGGPGQTKQDGLLIRVAAVKCFQQGDGFAVFSLPEQAVGFVNQRLGGRMGRHDTKKRGRKFSPGMWFSSCKNRSRPPPRRGSMSI